MPDPIGAASARLFAAGVERGQRMLALRFLGILISQADDDGLVRCDPDDLAGLGLLHGLQIDEIDRSRMLLEALGVLDREPAGWFIHDFAPADPEVPPAEFLAAVSRTLSRPHRGSMVYEPVPVPPLASIPPPSRHWVSTRLAAPVGLAAAVLVLALVLAGQLQIPLPGQPASSGNAQPATITQGSSPSEANGEPSGAPDVSLPGTSSPGTAAVGTAPGSTGSTTGSDAVCPAGDVAAKVDTVVQHVDSSVAATLPASVPASLPSIVRTTVSGTVHNESQNAVVTMPFAVQVNYANPSGTATTTLTTTALSAPTAIAPGASMPWSVTVDNPPQTPVPVGATASAPAWHWSDANLATRCPH